MNPEQFLGVSFCSSHIVLSEALNFTAIQVLHLKATSKENSNVLLQYITDNAINQCISLMINFDSKWPTMESIHPTMFQVATSITNA